MRATALALLLLALGTARVEAGGPNIEMKACTIQEVQADEGKIVLIVSGRCALAVPDPDGEEGRVKWVETVTQRCVITIIQRDLPWSPYKSWADYQAAAKALVGKTAWMQLRGTITLAQGHVASVRCTSTQFGAVGRGEVP